MYCLKAVRVPRAALCIGWTMNDYKISRFTLTEPLADSRVALFNTLTRSLALLPLEIWEPVANKTGDESALPDLIEEGFLVERSVDEDLVLAHWRNSQAYDLSRLQYMVSPTRACNMACSYCVHGRKKRPDHMSRDDARMVLDFLLGDLEVKQPAAVGLDFCGAESILNPGVLLYLAEGLARFCRGRGVDFEISLISNGLALTPDLVQALTPLGLKTVRVTVSGPESIHDRFRPAKDGRPTYSRILDNLSRLASLVGLGIQGQYDPKNGDHLAFPELLDDLAERGLREHVGDVFFSPIVPFDSAGSAPASSPSMVSCLVDEDPGRMLWLQDQTIARGFPYRLGPPSNHCLANYRNAMVIDVDGRIAVCPSMMDEPDLDYGHVRRGVDFRREARLLARELPDVCRRECNLAPLCDGGCRLQARARTGSFDSVNCLRKTYEHLTRAYVRQAVRNA